jgi:small subunit ribosomal protein S20
MAALSGCGDCRALFISSLRGIQKMANTPQAKKRIRRNDRRAEINGARVSRIRTFVKQVEAALASGDKAQAEAAIRKVQPEMMRGVAKGVVHKNTAARKISRLTKRVAALG